MAEYPSTTRLISSLHSEISSRLQSEATLRDDNERLRKLIADFRDWCEHERYSLGAVDGYDYSSGQEYGLRRAEIEIEKRYGEFGSVCEADDG